MSEPSRSHQPAAAIDPTPAETANSPPWVRGSRPDLRRQSPSWAASAAIRLLPACSRYVLRGGPQVMQAAGATLDLNISAIACRSARRASLAALWLGPDEQLLLAGVEATHAEQPATAISGALGAHRALAGATALDLSAPLLTTALAGLPHSLVDVSHRQIAIEVRGAQSELILSVGCPLDLHASRFPVGMCTRTLLGKAQIVLWRTGDDSFHVEVWRSFADYTSHFLAEAARELTC